MRGGAAALLRKAFLAGFSGRERSKQEKPVSAEKIAAGELFRRSETAGAFPAVFFTVWNPFT